MSHMEPNGKAIRGTELLKEETQDVRRKWIGRLFNTKSQVTLREKTKWKYTQKMLENMHLFYGLFILPQ
jgi:hypothetical protein